MFWNANVWNGLLFSTSLQQVVQISN